MRLQKLSLASFRNIRKAEFDPGARFNILYGKNGQGKTNLLEAIYLLATLKSFRLAKNGELMTWAKALTIPGKQWFATIPTGEEWWWCYDDELFFEVPGAPPSPSHP